MKGLAISNSEPIRKASPEPHTSQIVTSFLSLWIQPASPNSRWFRILFISLPISLSCCSFNLVDTGSQLLPSTIIIRDCARQGCNCVVLEIWKGKEKKHRQKHRHLLALFLACVVLSVSGSCMILFCRLDCVSRRMKRAMPSTSCVTFATKERSTNWMVRDSETEKMCLTPTISPHRPAGLPAWRPGLSENSFFLDGQVWRLAPSSLQMCQLVPIGQTRRSGAKLSTITCTLVAHPSAS